MEMHKVLARQLIHSKLSDTSLPDNLERWQDFLQRVNNLYVETDEERYILDRSMNLSSHEIMSLNQRLEKAQQIAGLGYWNYDSLTGKMNWSKELRKLVGLSTSDPIPNFDKFMLSVHPEYRTTIETVIKNTLATGNKYELEFPIRMADGKYKWQYSVGAPVKAGKPPYTELEGIAMDITQRKENEEKLRDLNTQIIASAREVGMADVAVSILHNVGNVLNSVNVSSNLLVENLQKSHFNRFFDACEMMRQHLDTLSEYLTNDEKGKLIPKYLIELSDMMHQNYDVSCAEVSNINEKIQHIRDIVMAQQSLSRVNGIHEKVKLSDVVKATISMIGGQLAEKDIHIYEEYVDIPEMYIDRARLMQILVNLLQNAKDAMLEDKTAKKDKNITISITPSKTESNMVILTVKDNGIGISKENIEKIFSYGFSTKTHGHGIGLHSSALSATELGGKLHMESDGIGQGAQFILELPINTDKPTGGDDVRNK